MVFSRFGFGRKLARSESEDFLNWTTPRLVLECDAAAGPRTQIYGAGVDLYERLFLAMRLAVALFRNSLAMILKVCTFPELTVLFFAIFVGQ